MHYLRWRPHAIARWGQAGEGDAEECTASAPVLMLASVPLQFALFQRTDLALFETGIRVDIMTAIPPKFRVPGTSTGILSALP